MNTKLRSRLSEPQTDTVTTPTMSVGTDSATVNVPKVEVKKDSATIKVPTVQINTPSENKAKNGKK